MLDWRWHKNKNLKISGNQHQGTGIDDDTVITSGRSKIRQAEKESPRGCYENSSKDKDKLVIDAALNTAPATEAHRAVADVVK